MDGGATFGPNFYAFRDKYFEDKNASMRGMQNYFPNWQPRAKMQDELAERLSLSSMVVKKEECLDLPPLLKKVIQVQMTKEQIAAYNMMKNDFIAFIEGEHEENKAVVAQLAITKALRLAQITSGFAKTEEGEEVDFKTNPKINALLDLLEQIEGKVIIWAHFKHNVRAIEKACIKAKYGVKTLFGDLTNAQKQENLQTFRNDPETRILIANQATGGTGLNLIEAKYSIFFSKSFSLADDLQAEARNYRGGSEIHDKITRIDLVVPETIDESISTALAAKQQVADDILNWKEKV
jgi:SNF2 family DNA or RNA helicase